MWPFEVRKGGENEVSRAIPDVWGMWGMSNVSLQQGSCRSIKVHLYDAVR